MPVIEKQLLLDVFYYYPNYTWTTIGILEKIEQLPFRDIVCCKDCIWRLGTDCTRFAEVPVTNEDYCSRGERKRKR